jgi:nucleoside-diphosphate-sugar epimerase
MVARVLRGQLGEQKRQVGIDLARPRGEVRDSVATTGRAERLLGFRASIGLEAGLRTMV